MDINGRLARTLKRSTWGRRLGVTGYRLWVSATHRSPHDPLVVNALAKSGTHLVMALLDALPGFRYSGRHFVVSVLDLDEPRVSERRRLLERELSHLRRGQYMTAHLAHHRDVAHTLAARGVRTLLVVRDPRALVVSGGLYMRSYERHNLHATVNRRFETDEELFRGVICGFESDHGDRHQRPMAERLNAYAPWLEEPGTTLVRFEDLVGTAGGGSREVQLAAVADVLRHVGIDPDPQLVRSAADAAFDTRAATFRSGEAEGWRRHLTPELLELLEAECREPAARLGYRL